MKFPHLLPFIATLAASVAAFPDREAADGQISRRQGPSSACIPYANPGCHIPTVCQCDNGWIYMFNRDNSNAGGGGCDPPWAFIAKDIRQHPNYHC